MPIFDRQNNNANHSISNSNNNSRDPLTSISLWLLGRNIVSPEQYDLFRQGTSLILAGVLSMSQVRAFFRVVGALGRRLSKTFEMSLGWMTMCIPTSSNKSTGGQQRSIGSHGNNIALLLSSFIMGCYFLAWSPWSRWRSPSNTDHHSQPPWDWISTLIDNCWIWYFSGRRACRRPRLLFCSGYRGTIRNGIRWNLNWVLWHCPLLSWHERTRVGISVCCVCVTRQFWLSSYDVWYDSISSQIQVGADCCRHWSARGVFRARNQLMMQSSNEKNWSSFHQMKFRFW